MKPDPHPPRPGGFTLVELLIVVAILAVAVTLAVPSLRKFAEKGELLDAARQLRAELLAARLAAIEHGGPAYFQYQPGGGAFAVIEPQTQGPDDGAAISPLLGELPGENLPAGDELPESAVQTLPVAVRFVTALESGADFSDAASETAGGQWSSPLAFYPNGRALNAQIRLATRHYQVDLTVRGLTGTVQISPPQRVVVADAPDAQEPPP